MTKHLEIRKETIPRWCGAGARDASLGWRRHGWPDIDNPTRLGSALQFGTLGRGTHILEVEADQDNRLWLMVHSETRGMGQAARAVHERRGNRNRSGLRGLDTSSAEAEAYVGDVRWAFAYAERSRWRMATVASQVVRDVLGVDMDVETRLECHHNFVRHEQHDGQRVWLHRKGAISARLEEPGIIPGAMGSASFTFSDE